MRTVVGMSPLITDQFNIQGEAALGHPISQTPKSMIPAPHTNHHHFEVQVVDIIKIHQNPVLYFPVQ